MRGVRLSVGAVGAAVALTATACSSGSADHMQPGHHMAPGQSTSTTTEHMAPGQSTTTTTEHMAPGGSTSTSG
jgi:hypothetical protein